MLEEYRKNLERLTLQLELGSVAMKLPGLQVGGKFPEPNDESGRPEEGHKPTPFSPGVYTSEIWRTSPVIVTSQRNKGDVGIIFKRINNTATKLTTFDLIIAWTWGGDFHLPEKNR